jgi:hypothetical protein
MPKYEVTYEKNKVKIIRASSLNIAQQRAEKGEGNGWVINIIRELPKE